MQFEQMFDVSNPSALFRSTAWFNHFATGGDHFHSEEALRKRLQQHHAQDDSERDGSDSSCSESVGGSTGGAFRPTGSPKDGGSAISYPSPNISVGPPIHPPPHLLPYLYPHGLYPPHHLSLLHNPAAAAAMNHPGLNFNLFNAQLALAAQHPALFGHYSGHSPVSPLHALKNNGGGSMGSAGSNHRFAPYNLPSGLGSAFDAVTPSNQSSGPRSLSSSPRQQRRTSTTSPPMTRPISVSPVQMNESHKQQASPSELKSIEKMVNGLDVQKGMNGGGLDDGKIILTDQWHSPAPINHASHPYGMPMDFNAMTDQSIEADTTISADNFLAEPTDGGRQRMQYVATSEQQQQQQPANFALVADNNNSCASDIVNVVEDTNNAFAWRNSWPPNEIHNFITVV